MGAGGVTRVVPGGGYPKEDIRRQAIALAMSRAMGHPVLSQLRANSPIIIIIIYYLIIYLLSYSKNRYGVSAEPEFQTMELRAGDRIIMASDGLWDVMENEEVALLASYRSSASKSLLFSI